MPNITLTTDFGTRDWFVGTMKGVILGINPRAAVVDISHEIAAGDIRAGAFVLKACCRFFPKGTIHVAVVDPRVGSARRAIAVQTADYLFVGPDNGILSWALAAEEIKAIAALENGNYFLPNISATFHGRDIFAPAAAHLSRALPILKLGPRLNDFVRLRWPEVLLKPGRLVGEVVFIDRFGNAITNIPSEAFRDLRIVNAAVFRERKRVCGLGEFYQSVPPGKPVALVGSSGFLEVAIYGGNATRSLDLLVGTKLSVRFH